MKSCRTLFRIFTSFFNVALNFRLRPTSNSALNPAIPQVSFYGTFCEKQLTISNFQKKTVKLQELLGKTFDFREFVDKTVDKRKIPGKTVY